MSGLTVLSVSVVGGDLVVLRCVVLMFFAVACGSPTWAQSGSVREKLNSAADRACVLATQLSQLCHMVQSPRTQRSVRLLMGAVCKPDRAAQRLEIEKKFHITFGTTGDAVSCSARVEAFERVGAEMRSIGIAEEQQRQTSHSPSS